LFIPIFIIVNIYAFYKLITQKRFFFKSLNTLKFFLLFISLCLFFFIGVIITNPFPSILIVGVVELLSVGLILFSSIIIIETKQKFNLFTIKVSSFIIMVSVIVSIIGLVKYFSEISGYRWYWLVDDINNYMYGSSIVHDYNFFSLFTLIALSFVLFYNKSKLIQRFSFPIILLYSLNIIFSYSRRGILILFLLYVIGFILFFSSIFYRKIRELKSLKSLMLVASIFFVSISFISFVFLYSSDGFKNYIIESLLGDTAVVKQQITRGLYRYKSIISKKSYEELYNQLWNKDTGKYLKLNSKLISGENYDPLNPSSGWIKKRHKLVYPITGENVDIVPYLSIACLLDSNTQARNSKNYYNVDLVNFNTLVLSFKLKPNKYYYGISYSYLSKNLNCDQVNYLIKTIKGNTIHSFDINKKEIWQEGNFILKNDSLSSEARVFFTFTKLNTKTIDSLRGYILYACPLVFELDSLPNIKFNPHIVEYKSSPDSGSWSTSIKENFDNFMTKSILKKKYENGKVLKVVDQLKILRKLYDNSINKKEIDNKIKEIYSCRKDELLSSSISYYNEKTESRKDNNDKKKFVDIKTLKESLLSSNSDEKLDSSFSQINYVDTISDSFGSKAITPRIERWSFAWYLFKNEYTLNQKIFGNGFTFLSIFGKKFYNNPKRFDWPHNPFIGVLLYSGIFGLLVFFTFLVQITIIYIKYWNELFPFLIIYLLSFFFVFFSGTYFFDTPTWAVSIIIPLIFSMLKDSYSFVSTDSEE